MKSWEEDRKVNEPSVKQGDLVRESIRYFIVQYMKTHGYPPSFREIGEGVDLCSSSSVHTHLKRMRDDGVINYIDGAPRTITVPGYGYRKL